MIIGSGARARAIKNFGVIKNNAVARSLLKTLKDLTWQSETLSIRGLPIIVMNPSSDDLTSSIHTVALDRWTASRPGDDAPPADRIDPLAFQAALGWIALLQPVQDGEDFVCRLFGSEIAWRFDVELTGKRASEALGGLAPFLIACCRACVAARGPVLVHCQLNDLHSEQGSCLLLPWIDDSGAVERIMAVVSLKDRTPVEDGSSHSALVRFRR